MHGVAVVPGPLAALLPPEWGGGPWLWGPALTVQWGASTKLEDAEKILGESEIRDAMMAKAEYLCMILSVADTSRVCNLQARVILT